MKKVFSILLLGTLSMLFAEVFSGASQAWFLDPFGVLLTFGLYLGHCLFFLWIALRKKKTDLRQLYMLGMAFGLYEAVITKVLWAGYMDASGPGFGTLLGVALVEFAVLVFFWHPIFSFILPVLSYEILTGQALVTHEAALRRGKGKTILLWASTVGVSLFVVMGNDFEAGLVWLSLGGSYGLVALFGWFGRKRTLFDFDLKLKGFGLVCVYLGAVYVWSGINLLPERFPTTIGPYVTILVSYGLVAFLFRRSEAHQATRMVRLDATHYGVRDLIWWAMGIWVMTTIFCLLPEVVNVLLSITYLGMALGGVVLVARVIRQSMFGERQRKDFGN